MSKRLLLFIISLLIIYSNIKAFTLSGYITDNSGKPLQFVNVMIKGTSIGGSSNEKGFYSLTLQKGDYDVLFSFIGYAQQTKKINVVDKSIELDIIMDQIQLVLSPVIINGNGEDPAYHIIREAQKKRKYYLE